MRIVLYLGVKQLRLYFKIMFYMEVVILIVAEGTDDFLWWCHSFVPKQAFFYTIPVKPIPLIFLPPSIKS